MKFWADENIPRPIRKALEAAGHEVLAAPPQTSDTTILRLALGEKAIIFTRDQDFRKYVLLDGWPCSGVIWLRFPSTKQYGELIAKLLQLIDMQGQSLATSFVTLSLDKTVIISLA